MRRKQTQKTYESKRRCESGKFPLEFRNHEFFDEKPGNGSTLTVKVTTATVHELTVNKVMQWLDRKPENGIDLMERSRLKRLLENASKMTARARTTGRQRCVRF